jgi:hypothetical protein
MATRFRLTSDVATPALSPAFQSYTHASGTRRRLLTVDGVSALTTTAQAPDAADHLVAGDTSMVQFVSEPLAPQTFVSGAAFKYSIQGLETDAGDNLFVQVFIGVYSSDGGTLLATLRSKAVDNVELATTLTNRTFAGTLSAGYTAIGGERLVVEFSVQGTPAAAGGVQGHNASLRWGDNGAGGDLPEDDTSTGTTLNPWLEFAATVLFQPPRQLVNVVVNRRVHKISGPQVRRRMLNVRRKTSPIIRMAGLVNIPTVTQNVLASGVAGSVASVVGAAIRGVKASSASGSIASAAIGAIRSRSASGASGSIASAFVNAIRNIKASGVAGSAAAVQTAAIRGARASGVAGSVSSARAARVVNFAVSGIAGSISSAILTVLRLGNNYKNVYVIGNPKARRGRGQPLARRRSLPIIRASSLATSQINTSASAIAGSIASALASILAPATKPRNTIFVFSSTRRKRRNTRKDRQNALIVTMAYQSQASFVAVLASGIAGSVASAYLSKLRQVAASGSSGSIGAAKTAAIRNGKAAGIAGSIASALTASIRGIQASGKAGSIASSAFGVIRAVKASGIAGSIGSVTHGAIRNIKARSIAGAIASALAIIRDKIDIVAAVTGLSPSITYTSLRFENYDQSTALEPFTESTSTYPD